MSSAEKCFTSSTVLPWISSSSIEAEAWLITQPSPLKIAVGDLAVLVELQVDPHHVAAERVLVLVRMGGRRQLATVEGVLVVVEDVFLVDFFFIAAGGHGGSLS